jgi:glycosyltransferase involved in cell wall biosynthesis
MLITVLMPMRNAQRYVRQAIESVLSQADVELEVLVIDDGSTDQSAEIVSRIEDPRVRMVPGPCGGISVALNHGLELARGEYIVRCDADDVYPPDRLAWQAKFLQENPDYAGVCGNYATVTKKGQTILDHDPGSGEAEISEELKRGVIRSHIGAFMIRAEVYKALGGFRPYFVTAEDIDLELRLGEGYRVWFEPRLAYQFRLHDESITYSQGQEIRFFFETAARRFQDQRRKSGKDDLQQDNPPLPPVVLISQPSKAVEQVQGMLTNLAWREHGEGHKLKAVFAGARAVWAGPKSWSAWRNLVSLATKRPRTTMSFVPQRSFTPGQRPG